MALNMQGLSLCDNELAEEEDKLISHFGNSLIISEQDQENIRACVIDLLQVYSRMNRLVEE